MTRENLLHLYERLTGLVGKLPGGLQKPILNELVPISQLFLEQRPARLLLLGDPSPGLDSFVRGLFPSPKNPPTPSVSDPVSASESDTPNALPPPLQALPLAIESGQVDNGWRTLRVAERGDLIVLDARSAETDEAFLQQALSRHSPDVIVLFQGADGMEAATRLQDALALIARLQPSNEGSLHLLEGGRPALDKKSAGKPATTAPPAVVALHTGDDLPAGVERLRALLHARREIADRSLRVLPLNESAAVAEAICAFLPNAAKLEFALLGDIRPAQVEIARSLLKSFTAVCGVIGMQPIPLADLPILTTLQSLMVGLIAYVSGRRLGPQSITEFFGAVGLSFGLGMVFREGARALVKVIPGFGNAVSGMVAGAGTYAIGRAAIAYFIERVPARETRKLFQNIQPKKGSWLRRRPRPPQLPG